jgi:hypothetical protein
MNVGALRYPAGLLLAASLWLLLLYAFRFGVMEVEPAMDPCLAIPPGPLCSARASLGAGIHFQVFGLAALALALLAWLPVDRLRRGLAATALFVALAALVLYNVRYGAPAAVLALLALVESPSARPTARAPA